MTTHDTELTSFKTAINLVEYASSLGFDLDRKKSCKTSAVMVGPNNDKVVIARQANGHWTYFSVHDPTDNGTIIDFLQNRKGGTIGHVRKELRAWLGMTPLPRRPAFAELQPIDKDILAVRARLAAMQPLKAHHPYLVDERCIPIALLLSPRFTGHILIDDRGNAIFPHEDDAGEFTGYEIKNAGFTGFASGGTKSLWRSAIEAADQRLVIAETGIDALSWAALHGCDRTHFHSIAGRMNPHQPALLTSAIEALPDGGQVIAAMDNDDAGRELAEKIKTLTNAPGCTHVAFKFHCPETPGDDWNDVQRDSVGKQRQPELEQ